MSFQNLERVAIPAADEPGTLRMTRYELPEPGECSKEWLRYGAADFAPSARQQLVMAATERAIAAGHFYSVDINEAVAADLGVTSEQRARNSHMVEGGDFAFDVYYAGKALETISRRKLRRETAACLGLTAGANLGTLVFSDGTCTTSCAVRSVGETGVELELRGKRGGLVVGVACDVMGLANAVRRAHERGMRPDSFDQFKLARVRERAGPLISKVASSLVEGLDEATVLSSLLQPEGMSQQVFLALQRSAESMDMAAAQGHDCLAGFDAEAAEISRLLEASPWTLHPDHGCVLSTDVEELDRQDEPVPS